MCGGHEPVNCSDEPPAQLRSWSSYHRPPIHQIMSQQAAMLQRSYVAARRRRELHDMLLCTVIQHTHTHLFSQSDREVRNTDCIKFGTQALLWIQAQIICPIRPVGLLCHIITPGNSMPRGGHLIRPHSVHPNWTPAVAFPVWNGRCVFSEEPPASLIPSVIQIFS